MNMASAHSLEFYKFCILAEPSLGSSSFLAFILLIESKTLF